MQVINYFSQAISRDSIFPHRSVQENSATVLRCGQNIAGASAVLRRAHWKSILDDRLFCWSQGRPKIWYFICNLETENPSTARLVTRHYLDLCCSTIVLLSCMITKLGLRQRKGTSWNCGMSVDGQRIKTVGPFSTIQYTVRVHLKCCSCIFGFGLVVNERTARPSNCEAPDRKLTQLSVP